MQRLLVRFVKRFRERRHETPACRAAPELRKVDDADQRFSGDHPAERATHLRRDRHIGMIAAKHDDGITGRAAVGARAQSPPDTERIHNRHPRAAIKQLLDESLSRVSLARAGGADDRNTVVKRLDGKLSRQRIPAARCGTA